MLWKGKIKPIEFGGRQSLLRNLKGLISASALDLQFPSSLRSPLSFPILCSTPTLDPRRSRRSTRGQIDGELEEIISHSCPRTQPSTAFPSRNTPAKKITTHGPANPRRGEREGGRENSLFAPDNCSQRLLMPVCVFVRAYSSAQLFFFKRDVTFFFSFFPPLQQNLIREKCLIKL